jgi:HK97 gp10 family phage protein
MNGTIKLKGARELAYRLAELDNAMKNETARGAVAAMGNVVRDEAQSQANSQGLNNVGPGVLPSGKPYTFKGAIPKAIQARVLKKEGTKNKGVVYVRTAGKWPRAPHWHWLEFGSVNNVPKPFMRPAITVAGAKAIQAAIDVLRRKVDRANNGGG